METVRKKKILLFNTPIVRQKADNLEMAGGFPKVGIASMAAVLREKKIPVAIVDVIGLTEKKVVQLIEEFNPDVVGISAFTSEIHSSDETAAIVKRINQKILTVVGGPHASALPKRTLQEFHNFDLAVFGEGEATILDIARGKAFEEIPGIAFRRNHKIIINKPQPTISNLDLLPFPAWDLFSLDKYRGGSLNSGFKKSGTALEIPIEGARGCPFNCNFCFRVSGKTIRFKSPERIIEEINRAVKLFGATSIFFVEGTFAVKKDHASKLCDLLISSGLNKKVTWSSGGRVNVLDKDLLKKMKKAGCSFLGYGVESGDQEMLERMGKQITIAQIEENFNNCREIGIQTEANFIFGHPYETEEKVNRTIKFARNLKTNYANFAIMVPFPGTGVYEMAKKKKAGLKLLTEDWRLYGKQIGAALESKQLSQEKLLGLQTKAYMSFYLTPGRLPYFIRRLTGRRLKEVGKRLIQTAVKIFF